MIDAIKEHWPLFTGALAFIVSVLGVFGVVYRAGFNHGSAGKNALVTELSSLKETHAAQIALWRDEVELNKGRAKDREETLLRKIAQLEQQIAANAPKEALTATVKEVHSAANQWATANAAIGSSLTANAVVVPRSPPVSGRPQATRPSE